MKWEERSQKMFEKLLKYFEDRLERGKTRITYKTTYNGKPATVTKESYTPSDLLTIMKVAGLYQPVQKVDVQHTTEDDKKEVYEDLTRQMKELNNKNKGRKTNAS